MTFLSFYLNGFVNQNVDRKARRSNQIGKFPIQIPLGTQPGLGTYPRCQANSKLLL